jgi:hypothetical protein
MKLYRGSRCIVPLSLSFGIRWRLVVNFSCPATLSLGMSTVTHWTGCQVWSGHFWRRKKSPAPTGIRTPDYPACTLVAVLAALPWLLVELNLLLYFGRSHENYLVTDVSLCRTGRGRGIWLYVPEKLFCVMFHTVVKCSVGQKLIL